MPEVICSSCGRCRPHCAKGLCEPCYRRDRYQNDALVREVVKLRRRRRYRAAATGNHELIQKDDRS